MGAMASVTWDAEFAAVYDDVYAWQAEPSVVGPIAGLLAELAGDGAALEFGVGTGRIALALSAQGVAVTGIELSPHMAERLLAKPGAEAVPVLVGDMTTTRAEGPFTLVYLVANTIMNVTTQDEQLAVFSNAAAHLRAGGRFVVSVIVPALGDVPPGGEGPGHRRRPGPCRDRDVRRYGGPDRLVASLDGGRRAPGPALQPLPLCLAGRTGPDGPAGWFPA
jgi:SAM-dependent methyltransferase